MDWRPIETAPTDGTLVIIWGEDFEHPLLAAHSDGEHHLHGRFYWVTGNPAHWCDLYAMEPSHWMPLPDPPTQTASVRDEV